MFPTIAIIAENGFQEQPIWGDTKDVMLEQKWNNGLLKMHWYLISDKNDKSESMQKNLEMGCLVYGKQFA